MIITCLVNGKCLTMVLVFGKEINMKHERKQNENWQQEASKEQGNGLLIISN